VLAGVAAPAAAALAERSVNSVNISCLRHSRSGGDPIPVFSYTRLKPTLARARMGLRAGRGAGEHDDTPDGEPDAGDTRDPMTHRDCLLQ